MTEELIKEVELECNRFLKRAKACRARMSIDKARGYSYTGTKETGALKRAALDLKNELTRITK